MQHLLSLYTPLLAFLFKIFGWVINAEEKEIPIPYGSDSRAVVDTLLNQSVHIGSLELFRKIKTFVTEIVQLDLFHPKGKGYSSIFTFLSLVRIVYS